jgi:hypothetical protein
MTLFPLSKKNFHRRFFPIFLFPLVLSVETLSLKAQSFDLTPSPQIAQAVNQDQEDQAQALAEKALALWAAEDFKTLRPYLTAKLQAILPVNELKRLWQEQVEDSGRIKKIGKGRVVDAINSYFVYIPVELENLPSGHVTVTVSKKNEIAGVNFPTRRTIQAIAEESVSARASGDWIKARDRYSPALKAEITPQQLEERWERVQKLAGKFKRIVKSEVIPAANEGDPDLVLVTLEFEKVTDDLFFLFNRQKQIIGVDLPIIQD